MLNEEKKLLVGNISISLSEAMEMIDDNSYRLLFLVDDDESIKACLSDGNIRRFILNGGSISEPAINIANHDPRIAGSMEEAKKLYNIKGYSVIPIVDEGKRIIDFYCGPEDKEREYKTFNVPVVINAGGRGSRLDPFTKVLPKPLIPVGDTPIIELIMREYQKYGCDDFHIIVNYKRDLIKAYFKEVKGKYNITWHDEDEPLGTGGGLSLLKGKIGCSFIFANCDVLLTADYAKILDSHKKNKNIITMVCAYKNVSIPYGVVQIEKEGLIRSMKEKPQMSFLINTGIYIVEPEVIDDMEEEVAIGFPNIVEEQKAKGKRVAVYPVGENDWMDMGQMPELERMRQKLYGDYNI